MKYSDIKQTVLDNWNTGNADAFKIVPYIEGKPGGGKSTLGRDVVTSLGVKPDRYVEFNPSLRDPTDILGTPNNRDREYTWWVPPEEFYRIRDDGSSEPCALLVEELSDSIMAMQNPLCRVILDRYAGSLKLHPKLYIIGTGNRTEDKSGANRMSTKLANRMQFFHFDESIDDWSEWALNKGIDLVLIQFLRFKPNLLSDFDANRKINPTPRSWELASLCNTSMPSDRYFASVAGYVGDGAAAEYTGFRRIYEGLPNIDTLLLNPAKAEVPTDPAVLYALTGALASKSTKDNFDRVYEYVNRMPADFQVMMVCDAIKLSPGVKNTKAFVQFCTRNSNLML